MILLVMLPMWMNFLLRTYSWMTILEGLLNQLFQQIGLITYTRCYGFLHLIPLRMPFPMIGTQGAVVLGMG